GKSLPFILATLMVLDGVILVIIPLKALRDNLIRRYHNGSITIEVFDPTHPPHGTSIIIITPESIKGELFI
ncbi:hypothetical protein EJ05DRAFT_446237, partial [Pseudovirgaria hyperparasitica]